MSIVSEYEIWLQGFKGFLVVLSEVHTMKATITVTMTVTAIVMFV